MYSHFFKLFCIFLLNIAIIFCTDIVEAEIKNIVGNGVYYLNNKTETIDYAKNQAKLLAEVNIVEQVKVYIQSYTEINNLELTEDEIITVAVGIINVIDVNYSINSDFDNTIVVKAIVAAKVDTEKIPEVVELEIFKQRTNSK